MELIATCISLFQYILQNLLGKDLMLSTELNDGVLYQTVVNASTKYFLHSKVEKQLGKRFGLDNLSDL